MVTVNYLIIFNLLWSLIRLIKKKNWKWDVIYETKKNHNVSNCCADKHLKIINLRTCNFYIWSILLPNCSLNSTQINNRFYQTGVNSVNHTIKRGSSVLLFHGYWSYNSRESTISFHRILLMHNVTIHETFLCKCALNVHLLNEKNIWQKVLHIWWDSEWKYP